MKFKAFYQIKAKRPGSSELPVILTFIERAVAGEAEGLLLSKGFEIVDVSPGYTIFRNAEDAVADAEVFCR